MTFASLARAPGAHFGPPPGPARPAALGVIVLLHALLAAGVLWWSPPVLDLASASTPLQVLLLAPERPPEPQAPQPQPQPQPARVKPPPAPQAAWVPVPEVQLAPPPAAPRITVATAPPSPPATAATHASARPAPEAPPPAPVAPPAPVELPPSAIQYLVLPDVVYPTASRRLNETGLVVVAVWVDADGLPQQVQLAQSSGFERLDRAALDGVRRARFKPYLLNGRATAGWARIPIPFELS